MRTGDQAPDFELPDQTGTPRRLSTMLDDGPVVLFFYPAAMSSGCTTQSCRFRNLAAEFSAHGAQRLGISTDSVSRQREFSELNGFDYPLVSDEDGAVAKAYGVKRRFGLTPVKRSTFVIGADRIIQAVISSELAMKSHADKALEALAAG